MLPNMKSFARRSILAVAAVGSALGVLGAARTASAGLSIVLPRLSFPAGKSYEQLAANWWQWALSQPRRLSIEDRALGPVFERGEMSIQERARSALPGTRRSRLWGLGTRRARFSFDPR